jgi:hypothetical protein
MNNNSPLFQFLTPAKLHRTLFSIFSWHMIIKVQKEAEYR